MSFPHCNAAVIPLEDVSSAAPFLFCSGTTSLVRFSSQNTSQLSAGSNWPVHLPKLSREKKDEIFDAEKVRHVVLEAPSEYLLGTWIAFDRALDLANKEGITGVLYPLFVYNIGSLLYQPTNYTSIPGLAPEMNISEARKIKLRRWHEHCKRRHGAITTSAIET